MHDRKEAALERLEDQIQWYDKQGNKNQNYYKGLKIITFIFTGLVPVLAAFSVASQVIGVFGFLALVCEGLQQLVDEALDRVARVSASHRAPPQHWNAYVSRVQVAAEVVSTVA